MRINWLSSSLPPAGTDGSGLLGMESNSACSSSSIFLSRASYSFILPPAAFISSSSAVASPPSFFSMGISLDTLLRRALSASASANSTRRCSSSSTTRLIDSSTLSLPRFLSASAIVLKLSRRILKSNICVLHPFGRADAQQRKTPLDCIFNRFCQQ